MDKLAVLNTGRVRDEDEVAKARDLAQNTERKSDGSPEAQTIFCVVPVQGGLHRATNTKS